ncbi:MAG: FAD-dependent tricarballylate dehydrogenase TcuA [Proteobacteria bacterium]|nr:FAD-dependent tricarballylate dehydrogenase TcuA [Pseudomonadota bacterium]
MGSLDLGRIDVIVVGAGNAATCAALSAAEKGAGVLMLEAAPEAERGGNSAFTGGALRFAYAGIEDLKRLCPDMNEEELTNVDFGTYTVEQYFDDMGRLTEYRCHPDLTETLIRRSHESAVWLRTNGVRFHPGLGRQAYKVGGRFKFWGGLACHITGGGRQLIETLHRTAAGKGIKVLYEAPALALLTGPGGVEGVRIEHQGGIHDLKARAVVLACGGFEANAEMRARYLGPNWDLAKVRGSRFNTGKGIQMALDLGAMPFGHWSGCHAVAWDVNAPPFGDIDIGDQFQKHNYPFGIVVNARGERFLDEGLDFHSYTYARYGGELLKQPGLYAWQVFDQKVVQLLRSEYRIPRITKAVANTLEELAARLESSDARIDARRFLETVRAFNAAVRTDVPFNPNVRDGRGTRGLAIDKSNWANPFDTPPFEAYAVTTGITFTFGGLKVNADAQVESTTGRPIPGLYAAGEIIGGLYYHNYASGTGLMAGAVFGRIAGRAAARSARG